MSVNMQPIAVVGMSCRLPGGILSLDDFWTLMSRARSGWGEIPDDRFSRDAYWHPDPEKKGCINSVGGYFLKHDISTFDAQFFNITRAEAQTMDPQQRQLLECTYEAMENAGIPKEAIAGKNIGVFVGTSPSDYHLGSLRDLDTVPMFDATGNHQSILAARIAHFFDFRGPCFSVDTACSSGLHAVHLAVQSIRSGETDQAVVASSHLNLAPDHFASLSTNQLLSEQGVTYAFDHRAKSGFARGEGTGCLILKALDRAIENNDKVWSVIVNTGINQDGRTVGITSPNTEAQERLILEVYANAGISTRDCGFVEAHGTGTKVGDPLEAAAIHRVFSSGLTSGPPLYVGSVKSNVGHLEPASGIISIIKASMMLDKGFILPNANFEKENEDVPFSKWNMEVPRKIRPWPKDKRFISINNFSFGGSNAHCVLEKCPRTFERTMPPAATAMRLFVLSANDEESANQRAQQLGVYLEQHPGVFEKHLVRDIAYTLCNRRSHLPWRSAMVGSTTADFAQRLNGPDVKPTRALSNPKVALVFTGQGAQWHAMGRELMNSHDVFASTINKADNTLKRLGASFSLIEELCRSKEDTEVNKAYFSQPICTAVQAALVDLLQSWGIRPCAVIGHSSGEIAAAYAAGALTIENALSAAFGRGQAVAKMIAEQTRVDGAMLAVGTSTETVGPMINMLRNGKCTIACENSPNSVTVSGDAAAIDELAVELEKMSTFNRKLTVEVAYHSQHMEAGADYYLNILEDLSAVSTDVAFYSSLKGRRLKSTTELDATYWVENLTHPVLFSTALQELFKQSEPDVLIEIGPHAALEGPIKHVLKTLGDQAKKITYLPSLKRNEDATRTMLTLAGNLFKKGSTLDFSRVNPDILSPRPRHISNMAPYPWSSQKYWRESRVSRQHRIKSFPRHDLLGLMSSLSSDLEPRWRNVIRTDDIPWLRDHKMQELTAFPFSGFVSMGVEAAAQRASMRGIGFDQFDIREMQVTRPLLLEDGEEYELITSLCQYSEGTRSYSDKWDEFRVHSYNVGQGWTEHCRGLIGVSNCEGANKVCTFKVDESAGLVAKAKAACNTALLTTAFYSELRERGASYGPTLQNILGISVCDNFEYGIGEVVVPDTAASMPKKHETRTIINAAFLDLVFQSTFVVLGAGRGAMPCLYMPSAVQEIRLPRMISSGTGERFSVYATGNADLPSPKTTEIQIQALNTRNIEEPAIIVNGFELSPVKDDRINALEVKKLSYKTLWAPLGSDGRSRAEAEVAMTNRVAANETADRDDEDQNGVTVNAEAKATAVATNGTFTSGDGTTDVITATRHHDNNGITATGDATNGISAGSNLWHDVSGVVILTEREESDPVVNALSANLELRTGQAPTVSSLDGATVGNKICINLYELDCSLLAQIAADTFGKLQQILLGSAMFLWVTSGAYKNALNPHRGMAQGLARTIRSETGKHIATLDFDASSHISESKQALLITGTLEHMLAHQSEKAPDMEFSEDDGNIVVPRIVEDTSLNAFIQRETRLSAPYLQSFSQPNRRLKLDIERPGVLDTLFFNDDEDTSLGEDEIEIFVEATGMNFKDVVVSMGQVASPYIGVECSGTVARVGSSVTALAVGDRVCAMPFGAYRTFARCLATSAAKIPNNMSMEVAASIPVAYCTAYYALLHIARLEAGERVLIHAGAGGVGQCAIQLAQMVGAEIFTTVGNVNKKQLVMDMYGIPEDHIFHSRSGSFGPAIRAITKGDGVDVVLNSLTGELLRETWDCIAPFGRFIEIGKRDITNNTRLEMRRFESNALFCSLDLTILAAERPRIMGRVMASVMEALKQNRIGPMHPITVMGISEVEKALRLLQGGKTTGKLVLAHTAGDQVKATHHHSKRNIFSENGSYIILGGTGGLGRSIAAWMVRKGAGSVVLVSRSGTNRKVEELIRDLGVLGSAIHVRACDIANSASLEALVQECLKSLAPVRGVVHATMLLRDMLYESMRFEDFEAVVQSKVAGAWNIHNSLLGAKLDFFVVLSSIAGIIGNRGQAAYAAANTFLDSLVRHRRHEGLPGLAIDLPAMDDVGYLSEHPERRDSVMSTLKGTSATEAELLTILTAAIEGCPGWTPDAQILTGLNIEDSSQPPYTIHDARFSRLVGTTAKANDGEPAHFSSIKQVVSTATCSRDAEVAIIAGLIEKLSAILLVSPEELDPGSPVKACGLDSLNAIELRNWISKELLAHLQVLELLTSDSLTKLATLILQKSQIQLSFRVM